MNGLLLASGGEAPPRTIFTPLWEIVKETSLGQWFEFDEMKNNLGQFWFEAICFCFCAALFLVLLSAVATRKYQRVPRGVQNLLEWAVGLLRGLVRSFIGESGDKYLPYLGTIFLFILKFVLPHNDLLSTFNFTLVSKGRFGNFILNVALFDSSYRTSHGVNFLDVLPGF